MNYACHVLSFLTCCVSLRLHQKVFKEHYGAGAGPGGDGDLEETIKNVVTSTDRIAIEKHDVAAVTPLMARAHSLRVAGEMVFLDASGNMDRDNLRVFLLMTWSVAGGLPLGIIVTTSEA